MKMIIFQYQFVKPKKKKDNWILRNLICAQASQSVLFLFQLEISSIARFQSAQASWAEFVFNMR